MKTRVFEHKNKPKKSSKGTPSFEMKEQKRQRQTGRPSG